MRAENTAWFICIFSVYTCKVHTSFHLIDTFRENAQFFSLRKFFFPFLNDFAGLSKFLEVHLKKTSFKAIVASTEGNAFAMLYIHQGNMCGVCLNQGSLTLETKRNGYRHICLQLVNIFHIFTLL